MTVPLYEWFCSVCQSSKVEMIPLSEVGDGKGQRHPMDEKPLCPQKHGPMTPLLGGKPGIKAFFPLAYADERYQDTLAAEERDEKRPVVERYNEAQERKRGEARIRRDGPKAFV